MASFEEQTARENANKKLYRITLIAIVLSVFSIASAINQLGITGAPTEVGYVNVTVVEVADISVVRSQINFTSTWAGDNVDSTESDYVTGCPADLECGLNITNVGNKEVNITIQNTEPLFEGVESGQTDAYYTYNITMYPEYAALGVGAGGVEGEHNCSTGYNRGLEVNLSGWRAMPVQGEELAICYLNNTLYKNWAQVDINVTIPVTETEGSKSSTITFTGYAAY